MPKIFFQLIEPLHLPAQRSIRCDYARFPSQCSRILFCDTTSPFSRIGMRGRAASATEPQPAEFVQGGSSTSLHSPAPSYRPVAASPGRLAPSPTAALRVFVRPPEP
ncbi:unnamed protein product [Closterium sp. NIES-54]